MKKTFLLRLTAIAVGALILCSCSAKATPAEWDTSAVVSTETPAAANYVRSNQVAVDSGSAVETEPVPFSSYCFDFSHYDDKYMVTAEVNEDGSAIVLTVEDNSFGFTTAEITPPQNYGLNVPFSQDYASSLCSIIKNTVNDTPVPEILEFTFYLSNFDDETLPFSVRKFYTLRDGKMTEITITDGESTLPYYPETSLYYTEPNVFMPAPQVNTDENGSLYAEAFTYAYDEESNTLVKARADTSEENMLYFGYARKAVADYVAAFFTVSSLNVTDYENYVEVPSLNSDASDYYFKVDDERFHTVDELKAFAEQYFSPELVSKMFLNAPQKYKDIDGELYTLVGDGGFDSSLGRITVTGWDADGSSITFHTKQEQFSDDGANFIGFVDGGDFTLDAETGIFTQYKFNMSY